jgi:hypothetical protein
MVAASFLPAGTARQDAPAQPSSAYFQQRSAAAIAPRHLGELILIHAADLAEELGQREIGVREPYRVWPAELSREPGQRVPS